MCWNVQDGEYRWAATCWHKRPRLALKHSQDITMKPQDTGNEKSNLWIFGYGSLVWKPNFSYKRSQIGHIVGYKRRFWHGDNFYRGNKEMVRHLLQLAQTFPDGVMISAVSLSPPVYYVLFWSCVMCWVLVSSLCVLALHSPAEWSHWWRIRRWVLLFW